MTGDAESPTSPHNTPYRKHSFFTLRLKGLKGAGNGTILTPPGGAGSGRRGELTLKGDSIFAYGRHLHLHKVSYI
jgi:hypothetical protein